MKRLLLILAAGTITAALASGQVLISVGDFDSDTVGGAPAGYTLDIKGGSIFVSDQYALSGSNSLAIDATGVGAWGVPNAFQIIPITPGEVVNFSGSMLVSATDPLTNPLSFGILKIEFKNSVGGNINPANISIGVVDGAGAASNRVTSASTLGVWIDAEVQATAPAGAVAVGVYLLNVNAADEGGTIHFDVIPEPATYALIGGLLALGLVIYRRRLKA